MIDKEIVRNTSYRMSREGLYKACETAILLCDHDREKAKEIIKEALKINLPLIHLIKIEYEKACNFIDLWKEM